MSKRKTPIQRIKSTYKRWLTLKNVLKTGFIIILVYLAKLLLDIIVGNWITLFGKWIKSSISPVILIVFQNHPYLLGFYVFIFWNIILFALAYFGSGPPRGLKLNEKYFGTILRVIVKNNTGHDLINCEAQVLDIILLNNDVLKKQYPFLGLTPKLRWYSRGFTEGITTEIKDKTEGIFGIVTPVKFKNECEFMALDFPYPYKIHEGKSKAEILFSGNTKQGLTINYKLSSIIDYDGKSVNVEIWT